MSSVSRLDKLSNLSNVKCGAFSGELERIADGKMECMISLEAIDIKVS